MCSEEREGELVPTMARLVIYTLIKKNTSTMHDMCQGSKVDRNKVLNEGREGNEGGCALEMGFLVVWIIATGESTLHSVTVIVLAFAVSQGDRTIRREMCLWLL